MIPGATSDVPVRSLTTNVAGHEENPRYLPQGVPVRVLVPVQLLVVRVGARFSISSLTGGEQPIEPRIVRHGPVILAASQAAAARANGSAAARLMRAAARQVVERARLEILGDSPCSVRGASVIARAVITLAAAGGHKATVEQVHDATNILALAWVEGEKGRLSQASIEPMMIGAAVLGTILEYLGADEIAVEAETPSEETLDLD